MICALTGDWKGKNTNTINKGKKEEKSILGRTDQWQRRGGGGGGGGEEVERRKENLSCVVSSKGVNQCSTSALFE